MRLLSFQMFPVPEGITSQHNRAGCDHDDRGKDRTAKGTVQRFVIRNDREGVEHTVKNDTRHQAPAFVEKDNQRKSDKHGEDDLADGFQEILAVEQVHNMPDAEGDR